MTISLRMSRPWWARRLIRSWPGCGSWDWTGSPQPWRASGLWPACRGMRRSQRFSMTSLIRRISFFTRAPWAGTLAGPSPLWAPAGRRAMGGSRRITSPGAWQKTGLPWYLAWPGALTPPPTWGRWRAAAARWLCWAAASTTSIRRKTRSWQSASPLPAVLSSASLHQMLSPWPITSPSETGWCPGFARGRC